MDLDEEDASKSKLVVDMPVNKDKESTFNNNNIHKAHY
jgi:hypothetical protein